MKAHEVKGPNAPISHFELEELNREGSNEGRMLGIVFVTLGAVLLGFLIGCAIYWATHRGSTKHDIDPTTGFNRPYYSASYEEDYLK